MTARVRAWWPSGVPGRILLGLLVVGVALRILAIASLHPTTILEDNYQLYAGSNPFLDPLHPAGYALILAAIGDITRNMNATLLLQHLIGIGAALLLYAATRRITGSAWAGLLPAGIVLLGGDEIFLEHSIMSESWELLAICVGLYAAVRAFDDPAPWFRWPLITGVALGASVVIRDASLLLIAVTSVALLVGRPGSLRSWRERWQAPVTAAATAAVVLVAYAGANAALGNRFGIEPTPGWYLYGRVAQFADCHKFTPPPGTAALCQNTPVSKRPSAYYYMFIKQSSPAMQLFGSFGNDDGKVGSWAERALRAQFGDFLNTGWDYFRSYYVPGALPARLNGSSGLDPQLDWKFGGNVYYVAAQIEALEQFFGPFTIHRMKWGLDVLRAEQVVFRFGATALFITTILTLIGLAVGRRRSRFGVFLFGVGGVSLLIAPALSSTYSGRYTVPMAGLMMAAAAITITELWRRARARGRQPVPTGHEVGVPV